MVCKFTEIMFCSTGTKGSTASTSFTMSPCFGSLVVMAPATIFLFYELWYVLSQVHMPCTKNLQQYDFDTVDYWSTPLALVAWAIHSTHHSTLKASPAQLVFCQDMLWNVRVINDWEAIMLRKEHNTDKKNIIENSLHIDHDYKVGDRILIIDKDMYSKLSCPTQGAYTLI